LAARRINELIRLSVDRQGVTNEQAVYYQLFNYQRYTYARQRLTDCGQPQGPEFDRLAKMPAFLAHATQPDGTYPMLGDTQRMGAAPIAGTTAEFAATLGRSGPKPASTVATYEMGFAFARTGWGEARPFSDETMLSVRFGRARQIHGHHDGSSITLYGHGSPLIVDPGLYAYHGGPYRDYFVGRAAHNLVVADRSTPIRSAPTRRSWTRISKTMYAIAVRSQPYVGVTARRTVALSRSLGYVVVDDRLVSSKRRTYRQLWHLLDGSRPTTSGDRTWTRRDRGNVLIVQLGRPAPTRLVTGSTRPIQGWLSPRYRSLVPAPVVEIRRSASVGRFLTLLVPYATTRPEVIVTGLRMTKTGFSMTITVDGRRERVVMSATGSSITPID
jgi:hypothetical protein